MPTMFSRNWKPAFSEVAVPSLGSKGKWGQTPIFLIKTVMVNWELEDEA